MGSGAGVSIAVNYLPVVSDCTYLSAQGMQNERLAVRVRSYQSAQHVLTLPRQSERNLLKARHSLTPSLRPHRLGCVVACPPEPRMKPMHPSVMLSPLSGGRRRSVWDRIRRHVVNRRETVNARDRNGYRAKR